MIIMKLFLDMVDKKIDLYDGKLYFLTERLLLLYRFKC